MTDCRSLLARWGKHQLIVFCVFLFRAPFSRKSFKRTEKKLVKRQDYTGKLQFKNGPNVSLDADKLYSIKKICGHSFILVISRPHYKLNETRSLQVNCLVTAMVAKNTVYITVGVHTMCTPKLNEFLLVLQVTYLLIYLHNNFCFVY